MMPSRTARKAAPPGAPAEQEAVAECAVQLRHIGDKWNLRQKVLNLLAKLFCLET
ncbi:phorbol-12-myristate-13-acetate-induced protein 1 [Rhea pennata]|uniref:phorbol-12-myristate-13-acetate-induced protein 1 n=1 Tax=Rhea pennata TaxID=8795 RepID=UPI002E25B196